MAAKKFGKNAEQIRDVDVSSTKPTAGQVLAYDSVTDKFIPELRATIPQIDATQKYHGFTNRVDSTIVFTNTSPDRTLTISPTSTSYTYYYKGTKITVSTPKTAQVAAGYGLSFIYFNSSGTLTVSTSALSYEDYVPVAQVYWNGSSGFYREERHAFDSCPAWHSWAHNTIGARYGSGLTLSMTGSGATATFSVTTGNMWDEDINFATINPTTSGRLFYNASASTLIFQTAVTTTPFKWNVASGRTQFADAANGYILTDTPDGDFVNMWVYATPDPLYPITFLLDTTSYRSATTARAASPPNLSTYTGVSAEIKIIYRVVVSHLGVIATPITQDDLRQTTSLPSGGINSISAAAVTFSPTDGMSSVNVQNAIAEVAAEREPLLPIVEVTGTSQQAVIRTRYIINNGALVTVTLPLTAVVGDIIEVIGYGAGGWKIAQNVSQLIRFQSVVSTTGVVGAVSSITRYDSVLIRCVVTNTTWIVENAVGELEVT